ncbi:MAG: type II toxin-antitoxin system VapC family toxin, partial [Candidatus Syntropharchaeia archaeon]
VFIAIADERDQWHEVGKKVIGRLKSEKIVISDFVISEVLTEIGRRSGGKSAYQLFHYFVDNCEIVYVDAKLLLESVATFLKFDGKLSLADAVSVNIMRKMGITDIISFDSDFDKVDEINRIYG